MIFASERNHIMKKLTKLLGLSVLCGTLVLGLTTKQHSKESKALDYETYIPMEKAFFTNWTDDAGHFAFADEKYWPTYSGYESKEGWQGTLVSRTWKQHEQYIYFQLGGAKDTDITGDAVHLNIHYGSHQSSFYNHTFMGNPMMFGYFKIPDAEYQSLLESADDFDMYIEIVDYQSSNYAFANFGWLHVNQTESNVMDAMRIFLNNLERDSRPSQVRIRKEMLSHFYGNSTLRELFLKTSSNIDENFESNDLFLKHWYFDWNYYNGSSWDLHFDRAIGFDSVRPEETTNMPFNKTGDGYFKGWYENNSVGGFVSGNGPVYRFLSRPFVVSGTGLVSIKMAGRASLHVIDTETRQELVWADSLTFNTQGSTANIVESGFNTVTMVRHYINLEAYLGRSVQLAIADVGDGDWHALYADELIANYSTYPSFKVDTFTQTNTTVTAYGYLLDKYINSSVYNAETNPGGIKYVLESPINQANENEIVNHVDNSFIKKAHDFLETYYSTLRSPANEFDYDNVGKDTKTEIFGNYTNLDSTTKSIVDGSTDIKYSSTFVEEWWSNPVDVSSTISESISELVSPEVTKFEIVFDAHGGSGTMATIEKAENSTYALPDNGFTPPEGYVFAGWTVENDDTIRQPGYQIVVTGKTIIHAQWEAIPTYTVTFSANGGSGVMPSIEDISYGELVELPECTFEAPAGKRFYKWQFGEELKNPGDLILVEKNEVIKAVWELIPVIYHTVSFVSNGGAGSMPLAQVEEGTSYTLPACSFVAPSGKRFAGWKVGDDTTLRQAGYEFVVNSDTVVSAQWEVNPEKTYVLTFDANGGTGSMSSVHLHFGESYTLPQCTFVAPQGKQFDSWLVGSVKYQPGQTITVGGDLLIKASWLNVVEEKPQQEEDEENQDSASDESKKTLGQKIAEAVARFFDLIAEFFKNLFKK